MTRTRRALFIAGGTLAVIVLGWTLLVGSVYAFGGTLTVQVEDRGEGVSLYLPIPMTVVDGAVATTRMHFIGDQDLLEMQAELGDWGPMVAELLAVLGDCPDAVLVDVEDGDERVRVIKEGRNLRVEVDEEDLTIRISLPARAAERTLRRLIPA